MLIQFHIPFNLTPQPPFLMLHIRDLELTTALQILYLANKLLDPSFQLTNWFIQLGLNSVVMDLLFDILFLFMVLSVSEMFFSFLIESDLCSITSPQIWQSVFSMVSVLLKPVLVHLSELFVVVDLVFNCLFPLVSHVLVSLSFSFESCLSVL